MFVLGIGAQWLSWRIRVPSILLLLIVGFLVGPITGFLPPTALQGDWVFAFVSLAIGVILFEGGLSLRVSDLQEIGRSVVRLITVGVAITWVLASMAAHYLLGFEFGLALQLGAILTVTGPTVVIPMLRHVRPKGKVATVARWEGITVDPVGAILAVVVLEALLLIAGVAHEGIGKAVVEALLGLFDIFFISIGLSITGAAIMIFVLRHRLVPDYLLNSVALMIVLVVFQLSNLLHEESGLLTVTLMGIMLANQKLVSVRRIAEFKEDLQVLLIGCLFILLSARLELSALQYITTPAWIFLGILIFAVRPIAVFISLRGTVLQWKEQLFLSWLAPRGIVAAAVASLFAVRLGEVYPGQVEALVPIVFLVIAGTVAIYGLTLSPFARYLGLATPAPQGLLLLGANSWVLDFGKLLKERGFNVLVIDANAGNIELARERGLSAQRVNALDENVVDQLSLSGIGRLLALTPNDEVNSLAALHFLEIFESKGVYQLVSATRVGGHTRSELPMHLRGRPLFAYDADFTLLAERYQKGGQIVEFEISSDEKYEDLNDRYEGDFIPLAIIKGNLLQIITAQDAISVDPGDVVIAFTPPSPFAHALLEDDVLFERLVMDAPVLDLGEGMSFKEVVLQVAALLAQKLPLPADQLTKGFLEGARYGNSLLTRSVALPHLRLSETDQPMLLLVRCRQGVALSFEELHFEANRGEDSTNNAVLAFIFLVSPEDKPRLHLRILSEIVKHIDSDAFLQAWKMAESEDDIRLALLGDLKNKTALTRIDT